MPKIPGVNHRQAVRALKKLGFRVAREGSHFITIPRSNPINAYTMAGIVRDGGLTVEEFRKIL